MNLIGRLLVSLVVLTSLILFLTSLPADWMVELGAPADFSGSLKPLLQAQRRGEQLTRKFQLTLSRVAIKESIAEALMSGRLTLIEAAECFRSLYEDPTTWHHPSCPCPSHDDGASWCRVVIEWIDSSLRIDHSPGQADALRQRLEEELQEQREFYGVVNLPD